MADNKAERWYVNLPSDQKKRQGNTVDLKVESAGLDDRNGRVNWQIEKVGDNTDNKYLATNSRALLVRGDQTFPRDGKGSFENTLRLPHVGGDKYKINVYKYPFDKGSKKTLEPPIETWRKFFVTVYSVSVAGKILFATVEGDMKSEYEKAFIEVEVSSKLDVVSGRVGEKLTNGKKVNSLYPSDPLPNPDHHLRCVLVNHIYDPKSVRKRKMYGSAPAKITVKARNSNFLIEKDPVKSVTLVDLYKLPFGMRRVTHDLSSSVTITGGGKSFDVAVPELSTRSKGAEGKYFGSIFESVYTYAEEYLGHRSGKTVAVVVKNPWSDTARSAKKTLATLNHEFGHACNQVVQQEQLYDARGKIIDGSFDVNGLHYEGKKRVAHNKDFGGQGPHCSLNTRAHTITPEDVEKGRRMTGSGKVYVYKGSGSLCTMYHAGSSHVDDGQFCDECLKRLKRTNLDATNFG